MQEEARKRQLLCPIAGARALLGCPACPIPPFFGLTCHLGPQNALQVAKGPPIPTKFTHSNEVKLSHAGALDVSESVGPNVAISVTVYTG